MDTATMSPELVKKALKTIAANRGYTLAGVARAIGWSPQRLNGRLRSGNWKISEIQRIATVLNCKPTELLNDPLDPVTRMFAWTPELPLDWSPNNPPDVQDRAA